MIRDIASVRVETLESLQQTSAVFSEVTSARDELTMEAKSNVAAALLSMSHLLESSSADVDNSRETIMESGTSVFLGVNAHIPLDDRLSACICSVSLFSVRVPEKHLLRLFCFLFFLIRHSVAYTCMPALIPTSQGTFLPACLSKACCMAIYTKITSTCMEIDAWLVTVN